MRYFLAGKGVVPKGGSLVKGRMFISTSGYNYSHWSKGVFYPEDLPQRKWLEYYAKFFDTVELNVSFYRLLKREIFEGWYNRTPKNFIFAVKGSRFITHVKKLKDCEKAIDLFFESAFGLKEKLGVVLWQLPPALSFDKKRFKDFCRLLNKYSNKQTSVRKVFEFRKETWFCLEVYEILKKYGFSLCFAHSKQWPYKEVITSDFIYLRFHGGESLYSSDYSINELRKWSFKIKAWLRQEKDVYAYFNNDACGFAVKNSRKLKELVIDSTNKE